MELFVFINCLLVMSSTKGKFLLYNSKRFYKKSRSHNKPFTLTEDYLRYYRSELKTAGCSFTNGIDRKLVYESYAEVEIDPLVEEFFKTHASIIRRHKFNSNISYYPIFEQLFIFTDAHASYQTLISNDVPMNVGQKQLTAPGCQNKIQ